MLKHWRTARRKSQLELALDAQVSSKHLSFLETGRAKPSREMLLVLASALEMPLRDRNALLEAAGFAAAYRETALDAPAMKGIRHALELMLRRQEPFGAVVLDAHWDLLMCNRAYARLHALLGMEHVEPYRLLTSPRPNVLVDVLRPGAMRDAITNWAEVARAVAERVYPELASSRDPAHRALLDAVTKFPGVRELIGAVPEAGRAPSLVIPVEMRIGEMTARMFSTIATLGTAQDVTLQELRIESFHPADEETERLAYALAAMEPPASA